MALKDTVIRKLTTAARDSLPSEGHVQADCVCLGPVIRRQGQQNRPVTGCDPIYLMMKRHYRSGSQDPA